MPRPDPEERFSLYPETGENVLKRLLGAEEDEAVEATGEDPEEDEAD